MKNYYIPISIVIAGLIIAGAVFYSRDFQPTKDITTAEKVSEEEPIQLPGISVEIEGWEMLGNLEATVTIVEYSDFACPFCGRFEEETLPLIKRDYVDTGKVKFVYKDFVVVGGDRAAEAAHCAAEQGKFWEYHDLLFERQAQDRGQWSNSQVHQGYAQQLGLDAAALISCFEERRYQAKVTQSTQEAMQNGGTGTPYFLINEQPVTGAQSFSVFEAAIEAELNK